MSGSTTRETSGEFEWEGTAGVLAELSRLLEGKRCEWLEEALCPGIINRDDLARTSYYAEKEEKKNESGCGDLAAVSSLSIVQEPGYYRRRHGRLRCVYCMRFDTASPVDRDGLCQHVLLAIKTWESKTCSPLFKDRVFQIISIGFARENNADHQPCGSRRFASYMRWRRLHRRNAHRLSLKKAQTGNKVPKA